LWNWNWMNTWVSPRIPLKLSWTNTRLGNPVGSTCAVVCKLEPFVQIERKQTERDNLQTETPTVPLQPTRPNVRPAYESANSDTFPTHLSLPVSLGVVVSYTIPLLLRICAGRGQGMALLASEGPLTFISLSSRVKRRFPYDLLVSRKPPPRWTLAQKSKI